MDAAQTVAPLPSVDAAVTNNDFALDAELDPSKALYGDDPSKPEAEPYINVFVARAADKDNPTCLKISELYHEAAVKKAAIDASKGTAVAVDRPRADLERIPASRPGAVSALDSIDLEIEAGELFAVIGHSGAGKSTLVRLVNALEHATSCPSRSTETP